MAQSPICGMINMFGAPEKKIKGPVHRMKTKRSINPVRLKELSNKLDISLAEFEELSSIDHGSTHIAKIMRYHVNSIYQMKITNKTKKYHLKYRELLKEWKSLSPQSVL